LFFGKNEFSENVYLQGLVFIAVVFLAAVPPMKSIEQLLSTQSHNSAISSAENVFHPTKFTGVIGFF